MKLFDLSLWLFAILPVSTTRSVTKRAILNDLSQGFCRSYKFAANIAGDVLYLIGFEGGLIPGDGDSSHNYLVQLDLARRFSITNGSNYKLSLIDSAVPELKAQALWSDKANTTLYEYGGLIHTNNTVDDGVWAYDIGQKLWQLQQTIIRPVRLFAGVSVNVRTMQSAFWVGGYQSSETTTEITGPGNKYVEGMIQFNTTTGNFTQLDAPFTPVQNGALVHIPVGDSGVLVYFGGETPVSADAVQNTLRIPNSWDYVQIYDIANKKWYNQVTTGKVASRTQFCAVTKRDASTSTYQTYVLGGADFSTRYVLTDVYILNIPSFKWYKVGGLAQGRMTLTCESYGRQVFGVGGRLNWDNDTGCFANGMPLFIYDVVSQTNPTTFDPSLTDYSLPTAVARDVAASPYPETWVDSSLAKLFVTASPTPSIHGTTTPPSAKDNDSNTSDMPIGAIFGGVVGSISGVVVISLILSFYNSRRKASSTTVEGEKSAIELDHNQVRHELLSSQNFAFELDGLERGR
ncbi:hypothetical protein Egran_05990 [Elaphomyces granulatus]|uniref:Kelch repeat protein n=1 Tax=Elaphomyces granulatus TaxID=519963 RepID=A0A232LQ32_9EURO|nr:hypothetical protein Egran_05990 [Elaphomyces granulatus]